MNLKVLVSLLALILNSCIYSMLSKEELEERGTKQYASTSKDTALDAFASALDTLGYRVTVLDKKAGLVKTAPRSMMVSAYGNAYAANIQEDSLAWTVRIKTNGSGVIAKALPRGFRNGVEVQEDSIWVKSVIEPRFNDVWREVDEHLAAPRR